MALNSPAGGAIKLKMLPWEHFKLCVWQSIHFDIEPHTLGGLSEYKIDQLNDLSAHLAQKETDLIQGSRSKSAFPKFFFCKRGQICKR